MAARRAASEFINHINSPPGSSHGDKLEDSRQAILAGTRGSPGMGRQI